MNLENKKVLVVGLARTGVAVARFLKNQGARITAADIRTRDELGRYAQQAIDMDICLELGPHKAETFSGCDLIVVSPGVPHTIEPLEEARKAGIPVIGELELAARYINQPIVAITGTNGKTTTTSLVGEMLRASDLNVFVGGNIGQPLIDYVDSGLHADVVVAEISSFQLDTMESFRPRVGVLLNVSEDHLDRYDDFQQYVRSKGRLFENQQATDVAVLNMADRRIGDLEEIIRSQKLYFNINSDTADGVEIRGDELICRLPGRSPLTLSLANFDVKGSHNLENAAAASLAALAAGGAQKGLQRTLDTFGGLPHRMQHVKTINGVRYYNDSKATNVGAVMRSVESFDAPLILIMGGRDKGGSYARLKEPIAERVKRLIAMGEAGQKILSALGGLTDSQRAKSLKEAVDLAGQAAASGDVVLLSPACSSFDMFTDYAERGEAFCRAVEGL
ncbi:MAG: UDP-N-acetylmuramoyl-L-alanine--D-glutamate ligase [Desulfobacterales bacterium]|nr:UDP-N-acetylmuramoyl-L-alanine--D-glutamate ligase [Desulfobacterales bacterium]